MSHLRYLAGFWICFDFRIYQSSEYTRVLNMPGYTRFWIKYFVIDVWQYSEYALDSKYATVLNMLGLRKLWIKFFIIDIWQGSEYALSYEYTSVTKGSVESSPSYMFDRFLSIPWGLNMLGLKYTRIVNMARLHMVLCKLCFKGSQYWNLQFWIC